SNQRETPRRKGGASRTSPTDRSNQRETPRRKGGASGPPPGGSHLSPEGRPPYNAGLCVAAFPPIHPGEGSAVLFADVPFYSHALNVVVLLLGIFLVLLILIQRGK